MHICMSSHQEPKDLETNNINGEEPPTSKTLQWPLLLLNATLMLLGSGGPLLLRLYFIHGGKRLWLASFLQVSGWPLTLLPLFISYLRRRRSCSSGDKLILLPPAALAACALLGLLIGLDSYLYAIGSSYLPLSTSSLVSASQLAFTAVFAAVIVRQRLTACAVNSVVLLTMGPVVLSLEGGGGGRIMEGEEGKGKGRYGEGLLMTVAAAALMGVLLPLMELIWLKVKKDENERVMMYGLVMEVQLVMGLSASLFCLLGMILNQDFKAMRKEAKDFGIGEMKYYMVLLLDVIFWQALNIGLVGLVSGASSLLGGILMAVQLPVSVILSLIFFKEKFQSGKGVALALSIWGFISYLYGEMKQSKKLKQMALDQDNQQSLSVP